jgi:hypothetical protein
MLDKLGMSNERMAGMKASPAAFDHHFVSKSSPPPGSNIRSIEWDKEERKGQVKIEYQENSVVVISIPELKGLGPNVFSEQLLFLPKCEPLRYKSLRLSLNEPKRRSCPYSLILANSRTL